MIYVLLSSYNGERYIAEQISSVLAQKEVDIHLMVRDDGSSDETVAAVERIARLHDGIISIDEANNIGACAGFLTLLNAVPQEAEYAAFCDQDDIWLPEKMLRAERLLTGVPPTVPGLYCSGYQVVTADLTHLSNSRSIRCTPDLRNALVEVPSQGCTMVLNNAAIRLLQKAKPDMDRLYMHDFWVYQVVAAFGRVVLDDAQTILYRQHRDNVIGFASRMLRVKRWFKRARLTEYRYRTRWQLEQLLKCYGDDLAGQQRQIVEDFLSAMETGGLRRLAYALSCGIKRQSRWSTFISRCIIGLGWM